MKKFVVFAVLVLWCAGCVSIPTSGPIEEVPAPGNSAGIEIAPQPPQGDDNPAQIVEGFLLAMSEADASYHIARSYLTPEASKAWKPAEGIEIFHGSVAEEHGKIILHGTVIGNLDVHNRFQPRVASLAHDFGLVEVDGQWRISNPPDGVLLSRYLFERLYQQLTIYFSAPTGDYLIPELLTVPEQESTPSKIVQALIDGPSERLQAVVTNPMPANFKLGANGATVDETGVATVDLAGLTPTMPAEQRRLLGAQLLWSLSSVPRVSGLRVTADAAAFDLPGQSAEGVLELATQQGYSVLSGTATQELYAVQEQRLGTLSDHDQFVALGEELPAAAEVAVPLDGSQLALIDAPRTTLFIGAREGALRTVRTGLTGLREGQWVLGTYYALGEDASKRSRMIRLSADGSLETIEVKLPAGLKLVGFSVNQAGATAAVLARDANDTVVLGRMTVSSDAFDHWQQLPLMTPSGETIREIRDVRWNSESTLVTAGTVDQDQRVVVVSEDGAFVEDLGAIREHVMGIAALPRQGGGLLAVRGSSGNVWRYTAPNRWMQVDVEVTSLSFAG